MAAKTKKATRKKAPRSTASQRANEQKWGRELWQSGWTPIPTVILQRQRALGLDPLDVNVLLHLLSYWWESDRLPFPSKQSVADCVGRDARTVQRSLTKMEGLGLIKRRRRTGLTNQYDFSGLKKRATPFAEEVNAAKERRKREAAYARRRTASGKRKS